MEINIPKRVLGAIAFLLLFTPLGASSNREPFMQDFLITAYYSPEPRQCCYITGGYAGDVALNGKGVVASDGTAVYPGMIAAPPSYPFGTTIELPGLGVLRVHDRGGAIQELGTGEHRLDIWVGHGEEGLARALEFGFVRLQGTVYPQGSDEPSLRFTLESLQAPLNRLGKFKLESVDLMAVQPKLGDQTFSTVMLQEKLNDLGYFRHAVTGKYGDVTRRAMRRFIGDYRLEASPDALDETTAAHIVAAAKRREASSPIATYVGQGTAPPIVQQAQRTLRFLGYYRGRTDGKYDEDLTAAILQFQIDGSIVGSAIATGAGRIGPETLRALKFAWNRALVEKQAQRLLLVAQIETHLAEHGRLVDQFLAEGDNGVQVRRLQLLLSDRGFFPTAEINGNFGPLTTSAVLAFQFDRGLIQSAFDTGAGIVGPATLAKLTLEERQQLYRLVRAEGWKVL